MAVHPSPRWLVGLCGNFQLTEREKGEQPIGTQHLGRIDTKSFFWGEGTPSFPQRAFSEGTEAMRQVLFKGYV